MRRRYLLRQTGRVFQTRGPATVNARSPTVERLTDGTIDDWCHQRVMPVGRADRQQEQVVSDTAAYFRVKLCTLERRPCTTRSAPGRAASDGG